LTVANFPFCRKFCLPASAFTLPVTAWFYIAYRKTNDDCKIVLLHITISIMFSGTNAREWREGRNCVSSGNFDLFGVAFVRR
jgi:hypothetical protein